MPFSKDATNGVAMPVNATEYASWINAQAWSTVPAVPGSLWLCQEASGNLADSIGSRTFTAVGSGISYQQSVTGWSTKGVKVPSGSSSDWFQVLSMHNLNTTPVAFFMLVKLNTTALRSIIALGGTSSASATEVALEGTGLIRAYRGSNSADTTNNYATHSLGIFAVSRPGSSNFTVYTKEIGFSQDTATPTWSAPPNANTDCFLLSGWNAGSCDCTLMRIEYWSGSDADAFGASQVGEFFVRRYAPADEVIWTPPPRGGQVFSIPRMPPRQSFFGNPRLPNLPAPTLSPNALAVYPGKTVSSPRHAITRPSFFGPPRVVANPTVNPIGDAGAATFAIDIEEGATVTYTWLTDVMPALDGKEQRMAIAYRPRQRYDFAAKLSPARLRRLLSTLAGAAVTAPQFLVGLSYEELTVAAGTVTTNISVHVGALALCDWASAGQRVVVVHPDGSIGESYIVSAGGTTITTFHDLSAYAVEGARIMPAMQIILDPNQPIGQHPVNLGEWNLGAFAVRRTFAGGQVGVGAVVNTYDGLPIWDVGVGVSSVAQQPMMAGTELLDLGGTVSALGALTVPDWGRSVRIASDEPADWQWLKKFFDTINGGRVAFLLPTGRVDLVHVGDASSGVLTVEGPPTADAPDYLNDWFPSPAHRRIQIVLNTGTVHYRTISSGVDNGNGTQDLTLDSPLVGTIDHVQFLETVRFDGGDLKVTWSAAGFSTTFNAKVVQR